MIDKNKIFINKSEIKHGYKYNYSLVNYINNKTKIKILCSIHGIFEQRPNDHLSGNGCPKCARCRQNVKTKLNNVTFIKKAKKIHGEKYDYSLVDYKTSHKKVLIKCLKHDIFEQKPNSHLSGNGCPKCAGIGKTLNDFISLANEKHNNKYDYLLIKEEEIVSDAKIKILCQIHGIFEQKPSSHLYRRGCPKCGGSEKLTLNEFIKKSKLVHGDNYDYSSINYINSKTNVEIKCFKHGLFYQRPNNHIIGQGCPICKESKGEKAIRVYLLNNCIKFIRQKRINECKDIKPLPFDFYLPDYNICIEYDGKQHFEVIERFGGLNGLIDRQRKDKIKAEYCYNNKIKLIRISYKENVCDILNKNI